MFAVKQLVRSNVRHSSTWQLFGAALIERPAVVVQKFDELETAYAKLVQQIEIENSLLSDFELREIEERKQPTDAKKPKASLKVLLTQDMLREWKIEKAAVLEKLKYTVKNDDVKNSKRFLDQWLVLLLKQKLGDKSHWLFPQAAHKDDEPLRQSAERAISDTLGDQLNILTMGNAPCAFYKYKYPKDVQKTTGFDGAKVFYFKVQLRGGEVVLNKSNGEDFMWATYDEMAEKIPTSVLKSVQPAMLRPPKVDFHSLLEGIMQREELEKLQSRN